MEKDLETTPRDTVELLKAGKIKLLDVRTPEEYAIARVEGSILADQGVARCDAQTRRSRNGSHGAKQSPLREIFIRGGGFVARKITETPGAGRRPAPEEQAGWRQQDRQQN